MTVPMDNRAEQLARTDTLDESLTKLGTTIDANVAELARLRKAHRDLLCSAKIAVHFMDQARTPFEMRMAVIALKEAIAEAERS